MPHIQPDGNEGYILFSSTVYEKDNNDGTRGTFIYRSDTIDGTYTAPANPLVTQPGNYFGTDVPFAKN